MKKKVFIACKIEDVGIQKLKKQKDFNVVVIPKPTPEELLEHIADAEGVLIKSNVKLTADILVHAKKLKVICRAGAGVDNVDCKKATEMGIPVTNMPGLNSNSVAEQVFCYINTLYKNITTYDSSTKSGQWEKGKYPVNELRGKTIGIGGLGAIGRFVMEKAKGYRMNVKVYDPYVAHTQAGDLGFEFVSSLEQLFKTCDIVTVHMPATPETKGKITAKVLCSMKENAIFINTARGTLLPPKALEEALASHKTLKAGVDVLLEEGIGEKELAKFGSRVVMTPHISGNSVEGQQNIALLGADILIDAINHGKLRNLVNFVKIPEELDQGYLDLAVSLGHIAGSFTPHQGQLEEIRITCYGKLKPYADLLLKPAVKGVLSKLVGDNITLINADARAAELGIKTIIRDADVSKNYGESITIDAVVREKRKAIETSIRGKLVEGKPAIVRINEFNELGLEPTGEQMFFLYDNKPGIIGCIASLLGKSKINIESILARNDIGNGKKQLLIIRVLQSTSAELIGKICKKVESETGTKVHLANSVQFG